MVEQAASAHTHMHDFEGHVHAVEEDLEYWRTKRLEPRLLQLHRRGIVRLYDVLRAAERLPLPPPPDAADTTPSGLERRIRALEDGLDAYVRDIALVSGDTADYAFVIEDQRKERGDYDAFYRIAKPPHTGTLAERVARLESDLADYTRLLQALLRALVTNGTFTEAALAERRAQQAGRGAWNGARIVARAWVDAAFKQELLARGRAAVRELGIPPGRLGKLGVAENTDALHHVVVCTLCSCYPHDLLGDPPWWYRTEDYRRRIVQDPRGTLAAMFDLTVPAAMEVRVCDSTSDVRWMVLPRRPAGTAGWSEEELARLVTQESMVGTAEALPAASIATAGQ